MLPMTDIREESGGKIETKNLILYEPAERQYLMPLFRNIWQDWFMAVSAKVPQVNWQPDVWLWMQPQVMRKR